MTPTDLARAAADEMSTIPYFQLNLPTSHAVLFVSLVQLALRNPEVDPESPAAVAGRWLVDSVRKTFEGYPAVQTLIDKGEGL